jgi:aminoglycoside phosphotransferase (APT) family kinase protein
MGGGYAPAVPEWSAEVVVDAALARRLIGGQFPDLADARLEFLDAGWDQTVWLAHGATSPDAGWAFRFPRRAIAVPGLRREIAVLPRLRLPLPIPRPVCVGEPACGFPWPWFGGPFIPGREPLGLSESARAALGRPLGEFLRALHADPGHGLPEDPFGRADMAKRVRLARERLDALGEPVPEALFTAALELPPPAAPRLAHGDLHFRHLLVDEAGRAAGVIDWGDLCRADPAIDMALYWCLLPPAGREAFRAAYGPVSDAQLLRARVLAVMLCAALALWARTEGLAVLEAEGLAGLRRAT